MTAFFFIMFFLLLLAALFIREIWENASLKAQRNILNYRLKEVSEAIRAHRDERGDDRCWQDDEKLYAILPEGYTPPERDSSVELENCRRFIACRQNPATKYVSPERMIEQLQEVIGERNSEIFRLRGQVQLAYAANTKDYWIWQGDGEDHLETLCCPVLIHADTLRMLIAEAVAKSNPPRA